MPADKGEQWPDCPLEERKKVQGLNVVLKDFLNPCELADQLGVQVSDLRSYEVKDSSYSGGGAMVNYIYLPDPRFVMRRKPKPKARSKQSRRSPRRHR